jgi:hypothetical protein
VYRSDSTNEAKHLLELEHPNQPVMSFFGAQIELIPHLFGATNRFPIGQRGILYIWRSSSGVTKPNALRLICSELLLDHLRVPTGYPSAHIDGY